MQGFSLPLQSIQIAAATAKPLIEHKSSTPTHTRDWRDTKRGRGRRLSRHRSSLAGARVKQTMVWEMASSVWQGQKTMQKLRDGMQPRSDYAQAS